MSKLLRTPTKLKVLISILTLSFLGINTSARGDLSKRTNVFVLNPATLAAIRHKLVGTTGDHRSLLDFPLAIIDQFQPASWQAGGQDQTQREVRFLPFPNGQTIEQSLGKGEVHLYALDLKRGEALRVDITEKGVNCVLALSFASDSDFKRLLDLNFGDGTELETFTYIAQKSGLYILGVGPYLDTTGTYALTGSLKTASRLEQRRAEAVRSLDEIRQFRSASKKAEILWPTIQKLESCVEAWKELKEDYWTGYAANELAALYENAGLILKACEYAELALASFRKTGDMSKQALTSGNLGVLYSNSGRHEEALKHLADALALFEKLNDESDKAWALNQTGVAYNTIGETDTAIEYYEKALLILKTVKNVRTEARARANAGVAYARTGHLDKATTYLNQALGLAKQIDDPNFRAEVLDEVADFYSQIGELQRALEYGRQALSLYQDSGNLYGQAHVHQNLGEFHASLGERGKAQMHLENAVALYEKISDDLGLARVLETLSGITGDERTLDKAFDLLKGKEAEGPKLQASLLLQKGRRLKVRGDIEAAVQVYSQILDISRAINLPLYEAEAWLNLADLFVQLNDSERTLNSSVAALLAAKAYGDPETEAKALRALMASWSMAGNRQFALATFYGKQALNRFQAFRAHIHRLDAETQKSYLRLYEDSYIGLAYILFLQGRSAEALEVIHTARDQQFYDINQTNTLSAKQIALTPREAAFLVTHDQMLERGVALIRQIGDLKRRAGEHPSTEQTRELSKLAAQMDTSGAEFYVALKQAAADLAEPRRLNEEAGQGVDLTEMQSTLRQLSASTGQRTVAIYVLLGAGGRETVLVTPDSVTASPLVADDTIDNTILQYYALIQSTRYDPRPLGKKLYDLILKPIEPALQEAKAQTILWSLGGTLRYLPMASLWDGEHYLVERYQSVVFTRADKERMTRADSQIWIGAGFGSSQKQSVSMFGNKVSFPELSGVKEELHAIFNTGSGGGGVKGNVFVDRNFTRASFLNIAKQHYPLVHVASHFSFRPGDDTQSFLLLGDGTVLTLNEMKQQPRLFEGVELLTLSACETAALRPDAMGREIDGFAESAQRLGAGAVMATLWTVADDSTPLLMNEFYRARQNGRGRSLTKAQALRQAQMALLNGQSSPDAFRKSSGRSPSTFNIVLVDRAGRRKAEQPKSRKPGAEIINVEKQDAPLFNADLNKPFAHPYYWAPFILIGNGR